MIQNIIYDIDERKKDELKSCLPVVLNRYFGIIPRTDKRKYKVCCPFHQEKTPSCEIDTIKGLYHCFGCGKSGDAFTLVAEVENLNLDDWKEFQQAAKIIADLGGVWLSEKTVGNNRTNDSDKFNQPRNNFNPRITPVGFSKFPNNIPLPQSQNSTPVEPYYIPSKEIKSSMENVKETGLYKWLIKEFDSNKVEEVLSSYRVGGSFDYISSGGDMAPSFPLINFRGYCTDCKIFHIDSITGSRKTAQPLMSWKDKTSDEEKKLQSSFLIADINRKICRECSERWSCKIKDTCSKLKRRKVDPNTGKTEWPYFGEHLLMNHDHKTSIAIVESEKTAIVCSIVYPKFVWLATGSKANLSIERFLPLRNYDFTIFPDRDGLTGEGNWKDKAAQLSKSGYHIKLDTTLINYPGEPHDDLADIIIRLKKGNGVRHSSENQKFSVPIPNRNYEEENISTEETPFNQSLHEMFGEFIPLSWLVPEPEDKDSEEWREWLVNRTAWAYDQRENFCRNCCHAVFYAETKFRCREKITIEEAASQKLCRGFQQKPYANMNNKITKGIT